MRTLLHLPVYILRLSYICIKKEGIFFHPKACANDKFHAQTSKNLITAQVG
jgi:hypothetical protein